MQCKFMLLEKQICLQPYWYFFSLFFIVMFHIQYDMYTIISIVLLTIGQITGRFVNIADIKTLNFKQKLHYTHTSICVPSTRDVCLKGVNIFWENVYVRITEKLFCLKLHLYWLCTLRVLVFIFSCNCLEHDSAVAIVCVLRNSVLSPMILLVFCIFSTQIT